MLNLKWIVICRRFIQDKENNLASLIDCVDGLNIDIPDENKEQQEFPINVVTPISVVLNWNRSDDDPSKFSARLKGFSTNGEEFVNVAAKMNFDAGSKIANAHRSTFNFNGFPVYGDGNLRFTIELEEEGGWKLFGEQCITVTLSK